MSTVTVPEKPRPKPTQWRRASEALSSENEARPLSDYTRKLLEKVLVPFPVVSEASKEREGYVYFLADDKNVKIGFTSAPAKRIVPLQTGNAYPLRFLCIIPGTVWHERALHEFFWEDHVRGEWFEMTPKMLEVIETLKLYCGSFPHCSV